MSFPLHLTDCEREGKVQKSTSKLCHEENSAIKGEGERWDDACKLNAVSDFEELIWILAIVSSKLDFNCAAGRWFSGFVAGVRIFRTQSDIALFFSGAIANNLSCLFLCRLNKVLNWSASETFPFFLVFSFSFWFFWGQFYCCCFLSFLFAFVFRMPTTTVSHNNVWKLISSSYFKIGNTEVVLHYLLLRLNCQFILKKKKWPKDLLAMNCFHL